MKKKLKNELLIYPCPTVLLTSSNKEKENVLAISWIGIASSKPEYITVAIKPTRYSYKLVKETMEFGINIPNINLILEMDKCGSISGQNIDKFKLCNFTKFYGDFISAPLINECPVNLECKVEKCIELPGHHLFIAKVLNKFVDENIDEKLIHKYLSPILYFRPNYYGINEELLGYYGYSREN